MPGDGTKIIRMAMQNHKNTVFRFISNLFNVYIFCLLLTNCTIFFVQFLFFYTIKNRKIENLTFILRLFYKENRPFSYNERDSIKSPFLKKRTKICK